LVLIIALPFAAAQSRIIQMREKLGIYLALTVLCAGLRAALLKVNATSLRPYVVSGALTGLVGRFALFGFAKRIGASELL